MSCTLTFLVHASLFMTMYDMLISPVYIRVILLLYIPVLHGDHAYISPNNVVNLSITADTQCMHGVAIGQ